jgi:hypothetical protein
MQIEYTNTLQTAKARLTEINTYQNTTRDTLSKLGYGSYEEAMGKIS